MKISRETAFWRLLQGAVLDQVLEEEILPAADLSAAIVEQPEPVSRAVLAQALNFLLIAELLVRVPTARAYMGEVRRQGRRITFDHGALRTVDLPGMGDLPRGERAITRILDPLGYVQTGLYPLERLKMTGRSYTHADFPELLPQFFVSELHADQFSKPFLDAAKRVTSSSRDPLDGVDLERLARLKADGALPLEDAKLLLPRLEGCFRRQHATPRLADYADLLSKSAEMAWIATEGNVFNHATDRVADIEALAEAQRRLGRPMKAEIETSRNGRVRQTAFIADQVDREFLDGQGQVVSRMVPGSFYEFIQRSNLWDAADGRHRIDLTFDSANAQGIFKMTAAV